MSSFDYLNQSIIDIVGQVNNLQDVVQKTLTLCEKDEELFKLTLEMIQNRLTPKNLIQLIESASNPIESIQTLKGLIEMQSKMLDELTHRIIKVQDYMP